MTTSQQGLGQVERGKSRTPTDRPISQQERDKSRTPTDHELPRDFPEGAFAMSALGIKERQDGRPPDLTTPRGRHTTAALVTRASGDVACAAWAKC